DLAIPPATIASLSSGEFVGIMADDPTNPISLKTFHARVINNHQALKKEEKDFQEIPITQSLQEGQLLANYLNIKNQIIKMTEQELSRINKNPTLQHLLIKKNKV
ncbi:MAG: conjugal transfer protein TraG, partial [Sphingobacterium sp.]